MESKDCFLVEFNREDYIYRMDPNFYHPGIRKTPFKKDHLVSLGNIIQFANRKPEPNRNYHYIQISSVNSDTGEIAELNKLEKYDYENLPTRAKKVVMEGDVLVSKIVENHTVTLIDEEHNGCVATNAFMIFRPTGKVSNQYLYYVLKLEPVIKQLKRYAYGQILRLTNSNFKKVKIPLPPEDIKNRIEVKIEGFRQRKSRIVSKYDNLVEEVDDMFLDLIDIEINEQEEEEQFIVPGNKINAEKFSPSFYAPQYMRFMELIKDKKYKIVKLMDIVQEITIGSPLRTSKKSGEIKYLSAFNIKRFHVDLSELKESKSNNKKVFKLNENDVVIANAGYNLGKTALVNEKAAGLAFNNHVYRLKLNSRIDSYFLVFYLNSILGKKQFERYAGGVGMKNIRRDDILSFQIMLPPKHIQEEISKKVKNYYEEIFTKYKNLKHEEEELEEEIIKYLS